MKHTGGCHCGKVRYEVEMNLEKGLACNCSICLRKGTLLDFVPAAQFKLLSGEDNLQDYLFHKKVIHHLFCKTCGVTSFARAVIPSGEMVAINVRCIDGVDVSKLKINEYDGASV
jgi:hypothetical protein